jgi:hypothetical protein
VGLATAAVALGVVLDALGFASLYAVSAAALVALFAIARAGERERVAAGV